MSRALYFAIVFVALAGCTKARTEAVVVVTTDGVRIPDDVDALDLVVADTSDLANPVFQKSFRVCGGDVTTDCFTLPLDFTLIPGAHRTHSSRIRITATRHNAPVIDNAAIFTFAEGVSLRLDFVLYANCLGNNDCASRDQACGPDAMCHPIPAVPISGEPDLATGPGDLAVGADLSSSVDLSLQPPDMTTPDMAVAGDMALPGPGDMALPPIDMAMAPSDMTMPPDMTGNTTVLNWTSSSGFDTGIFYSVYGAAGVVFAVGDKGTANNPIWKKAFAGSTLQFNPDTNNTITTQTLRSVWGTSKTNVYAVGDNATIVSQTGGAWAGTIGSGLPAAYPLNGVWIGLPGSPSIWTVGGTVNGSCTDTFDVGHFDGSAWESPESSVMGCAMGGVWSDGAGGVVMGANISRVEYTTSTLANRSTYKLSMLGNNIYIHGVWGTSMSNVYLVGDAGFIYHFNYNGGTPTSSLQGPSTSVNLRGVHGSSASDLWAVGGSQVLHSTGDGNWVAQTNLPVANADLYGVYAISSFDVYVVGIDPVDGPEVHHARRPIAAHHGGPKLKKKPNGTRLAASAGMPKQLRSSSRLTSGTAKSMLIVVCDTPNQSAKTRTV